MRATAIAFAMVALIIVALVLTQRACGADAGVESIRATVIVDVPDSVSDDEEFNVEVIIESASQIGGFQMDLEYDEDIIRAQDVYEGVFFSQAGGSFWIDPEIDNWNGAIRNIVCIRTGDGGVSGGGLLFTVVFEARKTGTTEIRITNEEFVDDDSDSVRVRIEEATVRVVDYPTWDVNQDGIVDVMDLVIVGQRYGDWITGNPSPNPDLDRDGRVDVDDLMIVADHFGENPSGAPAASERILTIEQRAVLETIRQELLAADEHGRTLQLVERLLERSPQPCAVTWGEIRRTD